ncbi:MAG TPA: cytosine deaminase, partial [Stellaceae bacterium]|nr:cytosine deaminase [Stellaceae bacterium]
IWPRAANPDGSFGGALATVKEDRARHWTAADIERRFEFGLRCAMSHGTVAIRTHLDCLAPQHRISWPLFAELRDRWRDRISLQAVALQALDSLDDAAFAEELATLVARFGGILGAVVYPSPSLADQLTRLLRLAARHGLDLDLHVDESLDEGARSLPVLAQAVLDERFAGRVVVGHCCSLTVQPPDEIDRTLDLMAAAGIGVVSLPMCNLYLQDRQAGRTPRRRGVTLLHEMAARGIPVAVASDNCRDPFYAYGDHDLLEVFRQAVRIAHLDHPFGAWPRSVTATPAALMGLPAGRLVEGAAADLVLFTARSMNELLARPQSDRIVLRGGRAIDTSPPDYAELDDLFEPARSLRDVAERA